MKICILTPRFPFPENGGDVLRINNIARYLKSEGHSLILVSYCEQHNNTDEALCLYDKVYVVKRQNLTSFYHSATFLMQGKPIQCGYYFSDGFEELFRKVVQNEKPELYISHLLRMAPYLERNGLQKLSIIEMTDALSRTYAMSSNAKGGILKRIIYRLEKDFIKRYEKHVVKSFPKVVLVSQADIEYINTEMSYGKYDSLKLYTNGVDCSARPQKPYDAHKICFIGNMRTLQNQDAVLHFANDIFPLILKKIPDARFYVVGAEPPRQIMALADRDNIIVTGFVEDLEKVVSDSCVAVAPVRVAAGIQNKVLVAMANGLPVIMTSLISKAIPETQHGENCYICDDSEAFANSCINLMQDEDLRQKISGGGYELVCKGYSWAEKLKGYERL